MIEGSDRICQAVDARFGDARGWLEDLIRIPSVSAPGFDPEEVRRSAGKTVEILDAAGFSRPRLLELNGVAPYVLAEAPASADAPTVLLYAHHDVQPPGRVDRWTTPPFEPCERDGRLYGRGSADDKAGIVVHAAAVRAWIEATGGPPCNVKVLAEGEEEIGSLHLAEFLTTYRADLQADLIVLADAGNWSAGQPALTYSLRGVTELIVRVRALHAPQHSGLFGGLVPDPVLALSRMLASLVDGDGRIAVAGFCDDVRPLSARERERLERLPFDESRFRAQAGLVDGAVLLGDGGETPWARLWMQPAIDVIGFDAHPIAGSSNQVLSEAAARISARLAPGQDPERCVRVLSEHLRRAAPWGVEVEIEPGEDLVPAWVCEPDGPAFEAAEAALTAAFGVAPVYMGVGGSIPFVGPFAEALGGVPALLTGAADPTSRVHSEDESVDIDDLRRHIHAEALLLAEVAGRLLPA